MDYRDENDLCPYCKTDVYFLPNTEMLVTPCGHKFCTSCISRHFTSLTMPCLVCKRLVKRNELAKPKFQDLEVDKEVKIRRTVMKVFTKTEADFSSLDEFNNYLEEIEEIVFLLASHSDSEVAEGKEKLEQARQQHAAETQVANTVAQAAQEEKYRQSRYVYHPPQWQSFGPQPMSAGDIQSHRYYQSIQEDLASRATGFLSVYPTRRGMQEAFSCLYGLPTKS